MRLKLITMILLCVWLMAGQEAMSAKQENRNIQPGSNSGKAARSRPGEGVQPPPALSGIRCKQIQLGRETKFLPDLVLLDQNGQRVHFYSDLIKDKVVLINFFYTSCSNTCLTQGRVFSELQHELGDRLGKEVFLISVSMDPETDTPERLHSWAEEQGQRKGWTLVTGNKDEMAKLVGHLTGNPLGRIELHSSFIYIGNDKTDNWAAIYGLAAPKNLVKKIEEMRL
jgi:cytochrome oxidase Cu insertion factor (SCO1/SenC/PrrC family)